MIVMIEFIFMFKMKWWTNCKLRFWNGSWIDTPIRKIRFRTVLNKILLLCFFFSGKMITAAYVPLANYHAIFPQAATVTTLLQSATGRWEQLLQRIKRRNWNRQREQLHRSDSKDDSVGMCVFVNKMMNRDNWCHFKLFKNNLHR